MQVTRIKKASSKWAPRLVASDGENYYAHCSVSVWRQSGKRMEEVARVNTKGDENTSNTNMTSIKRGMVFADGALWACGNNLQTSTDRGENWNVVSPSELFFSRLVETPEGLYACGFSHNPKGFVAYRPHRGALEVIHRHTCSVSAVCKTKNGVLFGDTEGVVWRFNNGQCQQLCKIEITTAYGDRDTYPTFWDAIETKSGAILFVGVQGIYRSVDGGKTFVLSKAPDSNSYSSIKQLPSGAIVAVGMGISVSIDDGKDFSELLAFEGVGYGGIKDSCMHGKSLLVASAADGLFEVTE